jgi:adenine-specific DNA methylase
MLIQTNAKLGLPYQGSKRRIATRIVDLFPAAPVLVDVFAGGCAITHASLLSKKFDKVIANDLSDAPQLFYYCMKYGVPDKPRWVSRDQFFALKDRDPLIRYVYSFNNTGRTYIYGREIEPLKRAVHLAVVDGDLSELPDRLKSAAEFSLGGVSGVMQRHSAFIRAVRSACASAVESVILKHVYCYKRIQAIRLQGLDSRALLVYNKDYRDLYIPDGAVVYCDPPYASTSGYGIEFDPRAFYTWCRALGKRFPLFVSEYWMPSDFRCVAEFVVQAIGDATGTQTRVEKIFTL